MTIPKKVWQSSLAKCCLGLLAVAIAFLLAWPSLLRNLFSVGFGADRLIPRGESHVWISSLVALNVSGDIVTAICGVAISLTLAYLIHQAGRSLAFRRILFALGLFAVACAATHFLEVWTLWNATSWLSGYVKFLTAVASLISAVMLAAIAPRALLLVRGTEESQLQKRKLETTSRELERQIVERRVTEERLRQATETLHAIFQAAPLAIYAVDSNGKVLIWNPASERIFGWSEREALGCVLPMVPYEKLGEFDEMRKRVLEGQSFADMEVQRKRKDGSLIDVSVSTAPLRDGDGDIVGVLGITTDITERKHVEAELDYERRLISTLFQQLPVGVLFRDMSGRFTKANEAAAEMLGMTLQDAVGMRVEDLYAAVQAQSLNGKPLGTEDIPSTIVLRTKRPTKPQEIYVTIPIGQERRLSIAAAPLQDQVGNLFGAVSVMSDVTERYALEEQLRQSQKMESIGTLAGGVAHDFNNLLTAILGNTQLAMQRASGDEKTYSRLVEVEKAAGRATSLTRQLLAFSRRQRLERKIINLNDTIDEVTRMLRRIIGEDVAIHLEKSLDIPSVFADPAQIEQVIMNLAVNARDAMPNGGQLVIATQKVTLDESYQRQHPYAKPGEYVQLLMSDTGTGMDAETKRRIFEPFFTTKEVGRGTGLGLSMVYGIVKQHEGSIEVYSEVGQGTCFKVYLQAAGNVVGKEEPEQLLPLRGGSETILLAEDEEALRGLAQTILEELGYTVLVASDGEEAVELFAAHWQSISLLVFDIVMPRMGGREALERILEMGGNVPALFMTGYSVEIVQSRFIAQNQFLERTGSTLMQKPYTIETFGRKVREVLDQTNAERK